MSDKIKKIENEEISRKDITIELSKLIFPFILAILIYILFFV
jgi:hypothetical protein